MILQDCSNPCDKHQMATLALSNHEQPMVDSTYMNDDSSLDGMVLKPPLLNCPVIVSASEDDELTNLTWLQDTNLLKNIKVGERYIDNGVDNDFVDDSNDNNNGKNSLVRTFYDKNSSSFMPYNPKVHVNSKPPYSFSCLIFMAIEHSPNKALLVKDIYSWMKINFPYFQKAPIGWKNSVRHNLSLNKCFKKVDKDMKPTTMGKGSYWSIDKEYRPNLLQALRKSTYPPYQHVFMYANGFTSVGSGDSCVTNQKASPQSKPNPNDPSPDLFPYLSKKLQETNMKDLFPYLSKQLQETNMKGPEADAAAAMLAMKNGQGIHDNDKNSYISEVKRKNIKWRQRNRKRKLAPILTTSPSADHTYSTSFPSKVASPSSSNDEAFSDTMDNDEPFCDVNESELSSCYEAVTTDDEDDDHVDMDEEQKKIADGANALLNLAGITTRGMARKMNHRVRQS